MTGGALEVNAHKDLRDILRRLHLGRHRHGRLPGVQVYRFSRVIGQVVQFRLGSVNILVVAGPQTSQTAHSKVPVAILAFAVNLLPRSGAVRL